MANSYVQYTGNGVDYAVPFQYLSKAHVAVKVNGTPVPFSWTSTNMVQLASDPGTGLVEIRRTTPNNTRVVDFTDGSVLAADDLDNSALQFLFLSQEAQDVAQLAILPSGDGQWDAGGRRIENASDPVDDQDLVTKKWAQTAQASQVAQSTAQAQAAAGSASAAAGSATAASGSASAAAGSQAAAKTSETNAAGSASAAAGSASTATQKANDASTSAGNAKTSETNAKTSEQNAAGSASAAAGSASAASTSAGQAAGSASAASTSATNAHTSEVNAAASAAAAAQSAEEAAAGGYSKPETDQLLAAKADKSDTYTKAQVDQEVAGAVAPKANTSDVNAALGTKLDAAGATVSYDHHFTFKSQGELGGSNDVGLSSLTISGDGANCAQIGLVNEGRFGVYFGLRQDNQLAISGWSLNAYQSYKIFNQTNLNPIQSVRLALAGDQTAPSIIAAKGNGVIWEPWAGAVLTGLAGDASWNLLVNARWRYVQVQDQDGNWVTVSYLG